MVHSQARRGCTEQKRIHHHTWAMTAPNNGPPPTKKKKSGPFRSFASLLNPVCSALARAPGGITPLLLDPSVLKWPLLSEGLSDGSV